MSTLSLPLKPSLRHLQEQAKSLQRQYDQAVPAARQRVAQRLPKLRAQQLSLCQAQMVLAREHGFADWSHLRSHVEKLVATGGAKPLREQGAVLTVEQAERLLKPVGNVAVRSIERYYASNSVFRVATLSHGNWYVKFYTARWYADREDAPYVAEREQAACALLARYGIPQPYRSWADVSRRIVSHSVYISSELGGVPVHTAIAQYPSEAAEIVAAVGAYLRRIHQIEFTTAGLLATEHLLAPADRGIIGPVETWNDHPMHRLDVFRRGWIEKLARFRGEGKLPPQVISVLEQRTARIAEVLAGQYARLRFTIGNCHTCHFHAQRRAEGWQITGLFDFEAASAASAPTDLIELEIGFTPQLKHGRWRDAFFSGYGGHPPLEAYKLRLLDYLLGGIYGVPTDHWPAEHWLRIINATRWEELEWWFEKPANAAAGQPATERGHHGQ